ncbi:hypothetical protein [Deinococcus radiophilus]
MQDLVAAESHCRAAHDGQAWEHGFRLIAAYGNWYGKLVLELLVQDLLRLNPKFVLEAVPNDPSRSAPLAYVGAQSDAPEPDDLLRTFYHSESPLADQAGFEGEQLNRWLDAAQLEFDPQRRAELYARAVAEAERQGRHIVLPVPDLVDIYAADIAGTAGPLQPGGGLLWKDLRRAEH